jgi:hypothetical protein
MLFQRTGDVRYRERADALLSAFSGLIQSSPSSFSYALLGRAELETGDTGTRRYAARGKVAVFANVASEASPGGSSRRGAWSPPNAPSPELTVTLDIAAGWHVNSSAPLEASLIATSVGLDPAASGWRLDRLTYPEPRTVRLGFQQSPLSVYSGRVTVSSELVRTGGAAGEATIAPIPILLRLQACDDSVCLRPEDLVLRVPVGAELRPESAPF